MTERQIENELEALREEVRLLRERIKGLLSRSGGAMTGPIKFDGGGAAYLRLSSMTTAERDAIPSITNGTIVYNSTLNKAQVYENGAWVNLV